MNSGHVAQIVSQLSLKLGEEKIKKAAGCKCAMIWMIDDGRLDQHL